MFGVTLAVARLARTIYGFDRTSRHDIPQIQSERLDDLERNMGRIYLKLEEISMKLAYKDEDGEILCSSCSGTGIGMYGKFRTVCDRCFGRGKIR